MTLYVKGYKVNKKKIAVEMVETKTEEDPLIYSAIYTVVRRLNRDAYLSVENGVEPPTVDGKLRLSMVIALEIGENEDELRRKPLGHIDESIAEALAHEVLVGPDVWELCE
jgi:hypothetical protein